MANEIQASASLSVTKNGATFAARASLSLTQSGSYAVNQVQLIGTSTEAIDLGDITGRPVYLFVQNLEAEGGNSIYIQTGGTGTIIGTLAPGQFALYPVTGGGVPYAQGFGGSAKLLVLAIEA